MWSAIGPSRPLQWDAHSKQGLSLPHSPELRALIAKCEQAVFKSGKGLGTVAASGALAKKYFDQGYSMIISGSDVTHLRMSVQQMLKDAGR